VLDSARCHSDRDEKHWQQKFCVKPSDTQLFSLRERCCCLLLKIGTV